MSSFNHIRFNLAKYNIEPAGEIWIGIHYAERIDALIATSEKSYLDAAGYESIRIERATADTGHILHSEGLEYIRAHLYGSVFFKASGSESVFIESRISQLAWMKIHPSETILHSGYISANNWMYLKALETIDTDDVQFAIGQLFYETGESSEVVDASVSAVALDEIICELAVTLRPGQVLVIDAGNYNVLVDGQNAIHIQNGAWLDELNRETQNVRITADYPSNLSATILYTERYL